MSHLQQPSDYAPTNGMHGYLGHFKYKKNYNAGHNEMSVARMKRADWADYYKKVDPEYAQEIKERMTQSERQEYDKKTADELWKQVQQKRARNK